MKDGFGKEVYQKGEYFKGHFEKGLKVSGSYFTKDGKQIQSYWWRILVLNELHLIVFSKDLIPNYVRYLCIQLK